MAADAIKAKAPGKANLIVSVAALTVLAAIGGGLVGKIIMAKAKAVAMAASSSDDKSASPYAGDIEVRELPPIVTNLVDPPETRVRLQVSILYSKKDIENPTMLVGQLSDDLMAFLKTLSLSNLQGASGLQALREDLNERGQRALAGQGPRADDRDVGGAMKRAAILAAVIALASGFALTAFAAPALAQTPDLNALIPAAGGTTTGRIVQIVGLLTVLSIAPGLLVMVTSFTRFAIAFSFLRSGLGLQTTPANLILISLSLFMTFYVMAPTFDRSWQTGLKPLIDNQMSEAEAFPKIVGPFRVFMLAQVRDKDLKLFDDLAQASIKTADRANVDLRILVPAFMISEIRRGFEIGFLIVLPFLVIDMIVATVTMSMGMMMLSPQVISLPMKLLFFVLIDGWNLLVGNLIRSYS